MPTKPTKRNQRPTGSAADFLPPHPTVSKLRAAAKRCRGCDLFKVGTQTVFGEGPSRARVMLVGETPGDAEDREGRPFVGPAGQLLDRALAAAGIDRDDAYVTNTVKHFKWTKDTRTDRRLHKTPNAAEVRACVPWLHAEVALVRPTVIVALGATAAKALLGASFRVTTQRGVAQKSDFATAVFATLHPSAILRTPRADRRRAERMFVADLARAARFLAEAPRAVADPDARRRFPAWATTAPPSDTSSAPTRSSRG